MRSQTEEANVALVREYLEWVGTDADPNSQERLERFYDPSVVQHELPNRLMPKGATRDLAALKAGVVSGQKVMRSQRFEVKRCFADGDTVVAEAVWSGELAIPLGALQPGDTMRAHFACFFELKQGRIVAQRNYDCFEAF